MTITAEIEGTTVTQRHIDGKVLVILGSGLRAEIIGAEGQMVRVRRLTPFLPEPLELYPAIDKMTWV